MLKPYRKQKNRLNVENKILDIYANAYYLEVLADVAEAGVK